jgi:hypothetical protein
VSGPVRVSGESQCLFVYGRSGSSVVYLPAAGGGGEAVGFISLADSLTYQDKHEPRNEASSSYSYRGRGVRTPWR